MADDFENHSTGLQGPASNAAVVNPGVQEALTSTSRGIYVGTGGNLSVTLKGGQTVIFVGVVAGTMLPIRCTHVRSADTTASNIVAVW